MDHDIDQLLTRIGQTAGACDDRAALVTRRACELVAELGLRHVAEGVGTVREVEFVRSLGSEARHGFLRGPAVRPSAFVLSTFVPEQSDLAAMAPA